MKTKEDIFAELLDHSTLKAHERTDLYLAYTKAPDHYREVDDGAKERQQEIVCLARELLVHHASLSVRDCFSVARMFYAQADWTKSNEKGKD